MNGLKYEFDSKPELGECQPISDGLYWLRMPLPFLLGHINLWLIEDGDGWSVVDTGINSARSKETWQQVFDGQMAGRPVRRIVVTHMHPDHVGCAGWLQRRFDAELYMAREEYLLCRILVGDTGEQAPLEGQSFYKAAGFSEDALNRYEVNFGTFGTLVSTLPKSFNRLCEGDTLQLGEQQWLVLIGHGHSPEHACLYNADSNTVISGDQILPTISSNVSVWPTEPRANPLKLWLQTLRRLKQQLPEDVLVLPAHGKPFRGAHTRLDALLNEHEQGLEKLLTLCSEPKRAIDTFPALFKSRITESNLIMATGEAIAHLHYLQESGDIVAQSDADGVLWYQRN